MRGTGPEIWSPARRAPEADLTSPGAALLQDSPAAQATDGEEASARSHGGAARHDGHARGAAEAEEAVGRVRVRGRQAQLRADGGDIGGLGAVDGLELEGVGLSVAVARGDRVRERDDPRRSSGDTAAQAVVVSVTTGCPTGMARPSGPTMLMFGAIPTVRLLKVSRTTRVPAPTLAPGAGAASFSAVWAYAGAPHRSSSAPAQPSGAAVVLRSRSRRMRSGCPVPRWGGSRSPPRPCRSCGSCRPSSCPFPTCRR